MNRIPIIAISICCLLALVSFKLIANDKDNQNNVLCETESVEVFSKTVTPALDEYEVDQVAIYVRNKLTGDDNLLFTTTPQTAPSWYISDGDKFQTASIDSIPAVHKVTVYNQRPLQLIVEGCPDFRNIFSYFVDVESRNAWYVPANSGYMGETEEGYMVFQSYRYVSDPEIGGRYTLLQVFDETGNMVDSLDLEHVMLNK